MIQLTVSLLALIAYLFVNATKSQSWWHGGNGHISGSIQNIRAFVYVRKII